MGDSGNTPDLSIAIMQILGENKGASLLSVQDIHTQLEQKDISKSNINKCLYTLEKLGFVRSRFSRGITRSKRPLWSGVLCKQTVALMLRDITEDLE